MRRRTRPGGWGSNLKREMEWLGKKKKDEDVKGRATVMKGRIGGRESGEGAISFIRDEIEETGHEEETLK